MIKLFTILSEIKISNKIILNRLNDENDGRKKYLMGNYICSLYKNNIFIEFTSNEEQEEIEKILLKKKIPYELEFFQEMEVPDGYADIENPDKYFEFRD